MYKVKGSDLAWLRHREGLSEQEFASRMGEGWYQQKVARSEQLEWFLVDLDEKMRMERVFCIERPQNV